MKYANNADAKSNGHEINVALMHKEGEPGIICVMHSLATKLTPEQMNRLMYISQSGMSPTKITSARDV
jgi:hypothetical protein